ncbi:MAG TPA: hypothetical protein VFH51_12660, partial [Myxococcota bacterium]|nr:hypothetical protein [Myxococcota bacterium]
MRRMLASLLGPALSLGWACNVLAIEPGTPLEVHLRWPVAIDRSQSLDPAEVRFEVAGCPDTFSVEAMWTYTGPLGGLPEDGHRPPSSVAVPFTTSPEGDYVARLVPQGAAEEAFLCASDDDRPYTGDLRLRVTCVDGRQAMTHAIPVRLAPVATRAASYVEANIDGVVATANPNRVFTYGQGWAGVWHRDAPERPGSLDEPLPWGYELLAVRGETFVSRDGRGYVVAAGCPVPDCGRTRLPDDRGTVENSYIYVLDLDYQESYAPQPQGTAPRRLVVDGFVVAGWVQQLVAEGDGTLRVLSFTPSRRGDWHGSWVSRVRDHEVSVERFWDGELPMFMAGVPPARPAGDSTAVLFAFAPSTESLSLRLRDLRSDTLTPIVLPDTVHAEDTRRGFGLDLAPEYDQWALAVGQDVYLGGPLQPWQ